MQCKSVYCDRKPVAKGLCSKHHRRMMKGEDVNIKTFRELSIKERLFDKVAKNKSTGCWNWIGSTRGNGKLQYGIISINGKTISTHRLSWVLHNGEIPNGGDYRGMCVSHKCDSTVCVNPKHLFLATHTENMRDKVAKGRCGQKSKMFCPHKHRYTKENTYICKNGLRHCRTCARQRERKRRIKIGKIPLKFVRCIFPECEKLTRGKYRLCIKHLKLQFNRVYSGSIKNVTEVYTRRI